MKDFGTKYRKDFEDGKLAMPYDETAHDEKWFIQWMHHFWGRYAANGCGFSYTGMTRWGRSIKELRDYGRGIQSNRRYRSYLDKEDTRDDKGNIGGLWNINWESLKVMPRFRESAIHRILGTQLSAQTQAMDVVANNFREKEVNKAKIKMHPAMQQMSQMAGIDSSSGIEGVETLDDLDAVMKMGGISIPVEIMGKDAMDDAEYNSNMKTLAEMMVGDYVDAGVAAGEVYVDASNRVRYRYIDIEKLVFPYSQFPDCRDIDFAGHWEDKSISAIRAESNLTEAQLEHIAKNAGNFSFPNWSYSGNIESYYRNYRYYPYDRERVRVLTMYWIAGEAEEYIHGINGRYGNAIYKKKPADFDPTRSRQLEVDEVKTHCVYKCKWVVGTDIVYDYGKLDGIVREGEPGLKQAKLPITVVQSDSPSLVARCVGFIDDMNIANYKIRHMLAEFPAFMMWWDKTLLRDSIKIGKQQFNMLDMVKRAMRTGFGVYESRSEFGMPGDTGSNRPPFTFQGIDMSGIEVQAMIADRALDQIRQVTGINELADSAQKPDHLLVGVMDRFDAATSMALRPYASAWRVLYENMSKYAMKRWQLSVMNGDMTLSFYRESLFKQVKLTKQMAEHDLGIKIVVMPTEQEKQGLMQYIMTKDAQGMMDEADMLIIWNMLRDNDLQKAKWWLVRSIEKKKKEAFQQQQQLVQQQVEGNKQAGLAVEQEKQRTTQVAAQNEAMKEKSTTQSKLMQIAAENAAKKEQIILQARLQQLQNQK